MADGTGARIGHISALDGARGAAVAGVLLFHGGHLTGGYLGVDFFFTLSGFLITSLLLAESSRNGSIGLGGFWARRARRLLPALAVLMVGIALYCIAFAQNSQLAQIRGDAFATLGYVANWREVFAHQNYFDLFSTPSPLNHTWSLAIEEQFYLLWPLVFVGLLARAKRRTPQAVFVTAIVLAGVSTVLMITLYNPNNPSRVYFGTDTRATAILLGAALAAWNAWHPPTTERTRRVALEIVGFAGVAVLAVAWLRVDGQSSGLYRGGFVLYGLAATAIIAAAVHPTRGLLARALSFRPLCALGLISYGLYLYHWPIDVALDSKQMGFSGWPLFAFQTAVALAAAVASYYFVEQPIRHGALSAIQWRKLTPAVAIALAVAIFATTTGSVAPNQALTIGISKHPVAAALQAYRAAPANALRVLIVGDSVAITIGPSFASLRTNPPLAVADTGFPGCVFPTGFVASAVRFANGGVLPPNPCNPPSERGVVANFRPDVVIWLMTGTRSGTYKGKPITPCDPTYATLYRRALSRQVAMFAQHGAKVFLATAPYDHALFVQNTDRTTDCDNQLRRTYGPRAGAHIIDLASYTCPNGICATRKDGVILRPDGLHYTGPGGVIAAKWLLGQVAASGRS